MSHSGVVQFVQAVRLDPFVNWPVGHVTQAPPDTATEFGGQGTQAVPEGTKPAGQGAHPPLGSRTCMCSTLVPLLPSKAAQTLVVARAEWTWAAGHATHAAEPEGTYRPDAHAVQPLGGVSTALKGPQGMHAP